MGTGIRDPSGSPLHPHPFSPNCSAFRSQQNPNLCGLALLPLTPLPFPVPVPGPLHSSTAATPRFPGPAPDPRSLASAGRLPRSRSLAMLDTLLLVPPPPEYKLLEGWDFVSSLLSPCSRERLGGWW